jgi:asparagine synthase (glutamine-hydrolysing)
MCGIAGILLFTEKTVDPAVIRLMTDLQHHRGPDDHGYAFFEPQGNCFWQGRDIQTVPEKSARLAFGHRRLSIIDLCETGWQPMSSGRRQYWITYNGEIYNYLELREELKKLGYTFVGTSDTEVILKSYEEWGRDCVSRFNGMWGFAIWDAKEHILFCSRDRVGIKPFYYHFDEQCFIFASEIKAVLAALKHDQNKEINKPYLARFILHGLLDDGEDTLFAHVKQLLPGHCMEIRAGRMKQWRYWDIPDTCIEQANHTIPDEREAADYFRYLLTDAIRLRFRADVPVGTCLSGGLDSSSVVALATDALDAKLSTFTTEYNETEFSEGHYARAAAEAFQTNAHYITPTGKQYIDFIDRFSWYHDEPCPGPGPFSQWQVMELASQHVKVVLDGQGADELMAGYYHYFNYYLTSQLRRAIINRDGRTTLAQYFKDNQAITRHLNISKTQSYLTAASHIANRTLPEWLRNMSRPVRKVLRRGMGAGPMFDLADHDLLRQAMPAYHPRPRRFKDDLNEILYWELVRDNIPMLLQYGDRTSMAFSIESRVPFLDYRLMEYVCSLPYHFKIRANTTKYLMRQSMKDLLPEKVVNRPDKKGYPTPFAIWLKGPIHDYVRDMLRSRSFTERGIFRADKVEALLEQHCSGRMDHAWLLWRVINIERWMQVFFDDFQNSCDKHVHSKF